MVYGPFGDVFHDLKMGIVWMIYGFGLPEGKTTLQPVNAPWTYEWDPKSSAPEKGFRAKSDLQQTYGSFRDWWDHGKYDDVWSEWSYQVDTE